MSFYDPTNELLNTIHGHFQYKFAIELQNPLPKNTYKEINPDALLIELAAIVKENEVEGPRLPSPPLVYDAPVPGPQTHGTGRGGLFGPAAASIGREILHAARKTMKHRVTDHRISTTSSSSSESWKKMRSLEKDINDFRTQSLHGISFLDEKYTKLRKEHIKPTVSGFQPKIKRL